MAVIGIKIVFPAYQAVVSFLKTSWRNVLGSTEKQFQFLKIFLLDILN